jgi:hypothetical protein
MKKERLSSNLTYLFKLTPLITISYGLSLLIDNVDNGEFNEIAFIFFWSAIFYLITSRWKNVRLYGDVLQISSYFKSHKVPISNIESVAVSNWWGLRPRRIILRLKEPSEFGNLITFLPKATGMEPEIIAKQLRRMIDTQT